MGHYLGYFWAFLKSFEFVNMLNTQVSDDDAARSVARVNAHNEARTCFDTELMQLQGRTLLKLAGNLNMDAR